MSSTASAGDVLPALPPIRTSGSVQAPRPEEEEDVVVARRSSSTPAAASSSSTAPDGESSRPSTEKQQAEEDDKEAAGNNNDQQEEEEPRTPTWEGSRLRTPTECPPAPRKPAWAPPPAAPAHPGGNKRRFAPSPTSSTSQAPRRPPVAFFPVARDLTTVFRALPPKKRIRAG